MSARAGDQISGRHLDRAGILRRWPAVLALVAMWIALWGQFSFANVLGGTIVALAVLAVAGEVKPRPVQNFNLAPALRYLATFARQLVMASYQVAVAVLRPDSIRPGVLAMPLRHASDAVVTLVANSITLTPGTLTLDTERRGDTAILYVHALDLSDDAAVRADIRDLERLAIAAFGGPDAQVVQARGLAELEDAGTPGDTIASDDHPPRDRPPPDPPPRKGPPRNPEDRA